MKLLRLIHSLHPAAGGPVQGIQQISPLLAALGVQTTVASLDPAGAPWLTSKPGAAYKAIGLGPCFGNYGYRPGLVSTLAKLAAAADLVVIHGIWQYQAFAAWRALRRLGTASPPYWVYPHGMLDPWFRRTYPFKHFKKWLYWPWTDFRVLRDAAVVCFTSEQERLLARESFWLYRAREQVLPYGIATPPGQFEVQRQAFARRFPQLAGRRLILCLARLHEKKGLDLLLQAFAPLARLDPDMHLMLAGPASGEAGAKIHSDLLARSRREGIAAQLHLPGMLEGELKWGALRSAELFALPSHQENFGIAVAEALACGLPVLISTSVNISAEVQAAGAGLVQADTLAATGAALEHWQQLSAPRRLAMSQAASRLYSERFELDSSTNKILHLMQASVDRSHGA